MKIKVSKYWWANLYAMAVCGTIMELLILFCFLTIPEARTLFLICMVVLLYPLYVAMFPPKAYLMIVEIKPCIITSFFLGRTKCKVYVEEQVYYYIFEALETVFLPIKTYIAISNEPFITKQPFWGYQDRRKQIVLPYNEKTKPLLPTEKWVRLAGEIKYTRGTKG